MSCPITDLNEISATFIKPILRPDPSVGTKIDLYDQIIIWTSEHLTPSQLNEWRHIGDPIVDYFFEKYGQQLQNNEDTYKFIEQLSLNEQQHCCDESCRNICIINFPKDIRQRPEWFNKEQIQRGQQFSLEHIQIILMATFSYTLILGYGFQQLNNVLIKTQYLSSPNLTETYIRLIETMQMIIHAISGDIDDFDQTFLDIIRVRLLHGMVRYKFKNYIHQIPINQEDSLITLLGFSFGVLHCMEERMGIPISIEDKQSCLHLWRYIGWLIGIQDEFLNYLSSYHSTQIISESIFYHFYLPSSISKHLVHHSIMSWYTYTTIPMSFKFYLGLSQILLGEQLSQALGIDQPEMDLIHRYTIDFVFQMFRILSRLIKLNNRSFNTWISKRNKQKLNKLIHSRLRNFSLFKTYKSNSNTIETKSVKECPCRYYQKKNDGIIQTNDIGPFRISSNFFLQILCVIFCFFLFNSIIKIFCFYSGVFYLFQQRRFCVASFKPKHRRTI
jgi:hypothetical protein